MKTIIIAMIANYLIGNKVFEQIKQLVTDQEKRLISGIEKKHSVAMEAKKLGIQISASLLNLAIELAVQYVKSV